MAVDLLRKVLEEIRGTGEPEAPYTDETGGIYHDITLKETDDDGVTPRLAPGMYGSMQVMYTGIGEVLEISDEVVIVANNVPDVIIVADNIASVNTAAFDIANINTNATNIADINTTATNIANVNTVAANDVNVTKVANIDTDVTTVANNDANVTIVADNDVNITAVASNTTNINAAVANEVNINAAVTNEANINSAVANQADIDTVALNVVSVNTVAANDANVTTVAANDANVTIVADNDTNVTTVGTDIDNVNVVADGIADVNNYADTYYGSLAIAPTTGSHPTLTVGDLYYDTALDELRVYDNGNTWKASGSTVNGTDKSEQFIVGTASGIYDGVSLNTFPMTDGYDAGFAVVSRNGFILAESDIDISSGTNVVLTADAVAGDIIKVIAFGAFVLADHYTKAQQDVTDATKAPQATTYTKIETDAEIASRALKTNVLELDNTTVFTPNADYEPATKKYVDDCTNPSAYTSSYGLNWDQTDDSYVRTGSSNYLAIQALMRRCVLNADCSVNYYLDPQDSTKKADGSPSLLDGTDGNVMVEIPKFYYKYEYISGTNIIHSHSISLTPDSGYIIHPAFVRNGVELEHRYHAAYEGYEDAGVLKSISGVYPTTNQTITTFRDYAEANGVGWFQKDWLLHEAITLLCIIEYGTMNIQNTLGEGRTALTGGSWVGGSYIGITGLSNHNGNATGNNTYAGDADNVPADSSYMSYRGIENFFGNIWKFADGVLFNDNIPYVNQKPSSYDSTILTVDDVSTGVSMTASDGYASELGNSGKGFFPTSIAGGSSSLGTTDYFYANDAGELGVALVGGSATDGLTAGLLYLYAANVASNVHVKVGGLLSC